MKRLTEKKLNKLQQHFVIQSLGAGWEPADVVEQLESEFGIHVTRQNIRDNYLIARSDEVEAAAVEIEKNLKKNFPLAKKSRRMAQLQEANRKLRDGWLKTMRTFAEKYMEAKGTEKAEVLFDALGKLEAEFEKALDYELRILRQVKDEVEGSTMRIKGDKSMNTDEQKEFEGAMRKKFKNMPEKKFSEMMSALLNKVGVDHADISAD